jgi:uncharacterized protein (UPF0335 family)
MRIQASPQEAAGEGIWGPNGPAKRPTASAGGRVALRPCCSYVSGPGAAGLTFLVGLHMAKTGFAKDRLRSFVERVERLEEEKKALSDDIKEVYAEAKGEGFDVKTMRQVVRLRKLDKADFQEAEALLETYKRALNMID